MNWEHPTEAMRARILGEPITCLTCTHMRGPTSAGHWCPKQENDPNPGRAANEPAQTCKHWYPI